MFRDQPSRASLEREGSNSRGRPNRKYRTMSSIDGDVGIGRGRQADSSSSREPSPQLTQKRSFTPTSDDDDMVVPPAQDDETPSPDGPILRQALGFSGPKSATVAQVNTYEAALPPKPTQFLPGQAVGLTAPAAPSPKTRKPKSNKNKARHFNDEFSSQTGSFRLASYVNDPKAPSVEPPTHYGTGPYSSMYRVSPPPPGEASTAGSSSNNRRKKPAQRAGSDSGPRSGPGRQNTFSVPSLHDRRQASNSFINNQSGGTSSADRRKKATHHSISSKHTATPSGSGAQSPRPYGLQPSVPRPASSGRLAPNSFNQQPRPSARAHNTGHSTSPSGPRRQMRQLRMLTILLEDVRSMETDHQLAEVKVPLRLADDPEDGYWADAFEIAEALQASPSRIDGPAKAYTLRGKYRQIFMRISADNELDCAPANIIVSPQRTLDVFVEPNPPLDGGLPNIPRGLARARSATPERQPSFDPETQTMMLESEDMRRMTASDIIERFNHKRKLPSSFDNYDSPEPSSAVHHRQHGSPSRTVASSHTMSPYNSPSLASSMHPAAPASKKQRGYPTGSIPGHSGEYGGADDGSSSRRPHVSERDYTPDSDESREDLGDSIFMAVQPIIADDPEWIEFTKLRALPQPQSISVLLKQYRFVQRKVDEWEGRRAPLDSAVFHTVDKLHVLRALYVDERWGSECMETLHLLSLYGRDGTHHTDPRVTAAIDDLAPPTGKSAKRLLKLLRDIDREWADERALSEASPG